MYDGSGLVLLQGILDASVRNQPHYCNGEINQLCNPGTGGGTRGLRQFQRLLHASAQGWPATAACQCAGHCLSCGRRHQRHLPQRFRNGHFATVYVSPKDYHRVHMPFGGLLRECVYVPGDLYPVNQTTAVKIDGLFARNECGAEHRRDRLSGA